MSRLADFFPQTLLNGSPLPADAITGKVVLVVNTASLCGFTPQYAGLEALHQQYRERGLVVLGFPCNQFGQQEPGDAAAIGEFCSSRFGISFAMAAKCEVNGPATTPLWQWLKTQKRGLLFSPRIKWNFTKFLLNRDGQVVRRYAPWVKPERIAADIERLL